MVTVPGRERAGVAPELSPMAAVVDGRLFAAQAFLFQRVLPTRTTSRITGAFFAKAADGGR
jgi:hypothetical protein